MATISVTFRNDSGVSDKFTVLDIGISPTNPKTLFDDYLDPGKDTGPEDVYQDGIHGHVQFKRGGGVAQLLDVSDGDVVSMT